MTITAEIHSTRPDRISLESPYRYKDLIKSIPGSRWSKDDNLWSVPLSWTACLALRAVFTDDLVIGDDLKKWAKGHKENVIWPASYWRDQMDAPGNEQLYSFQRAGVAWMRTVRRGLLADEMGSGKTVQTITALREMTLTGELPEGPILIVCPNTMKGTWKRELATWWPEVTAVAVQGTAVQRRKQIESGADVLIINWESLRAHSRLLHFGSTALRVCEDCGGTGTVKPAQCEKHPRELNSIDFSAVVADEAHRALDPHSKQTRALRAASGDAQIRFALTGTPISKDPTQLWTVLNWLDEQEWPTKSAWVERMVDFSHNIFGGMEINGLNPVTETEFHATVDPKMRRMLKEVVLPFLPPIVRERRDVEMSPKQKKQYGDMRDMLVARLDSGTLLAQSPMVQVGRLTQLASTCGDIETRMVPQRDPKTGEIVLDESGNQVLVPKEFMLPIDPSCKLDAFMEDIPDFEGQSIAVFAEHRTVIEMLSERMTKKNIRHGLITGMVTEEARDRAIADFQKGEYQFVLATIKAGGTGVTLTKASTAAFLQRNFSPVEMDQAYARVHRIGSEIHDSITIIDYITTDTIEDAQIGILNKKGQMIEEIVRDEEALRRLIKGDWS